MLLVVLGSVHSHEGALVLWHLQVWPPPAPIQRMASHSAQAGSPSGAFLRAECREAPCCFETGGTAIGA